MASTIWEEEVVNELLSPFLCPPPAWHFHVCHSVLGMTLQSRLCSRCFLDEETQTTGAVGDEYGTGIWAPATGSLPLEERQGCCHCSTMTWCSRLSHRGSAPPCTASTSFIRLRFTRLKDSPMEATSSSRTSMSSSLGQWMPMTWGNTWRAPQWW